MDEDDDSWQTQKKAPKNQTPEVIQNAMSSVLLFLQSYGWYVLFALIVIYYLKGKLAQHINRWRSAYSQNIDLHRYDDGTLLSRQQALEESRRRMQEQLNAQAALYAEQQQKKEEEKRRQKIDDWERHQEGKGYRSKYKPQEAAAAPPPTSSGPTRKNVYRTENRNPLSDGGGSCSYRPSRRGGASGGG